MILDATSTRQETLITSILRSSHDVRKFMITKPFKGTIMGLKSKRMFSICIYHT
jgi:hypothetical protein